MFSAMLGTLQYTTNIYTSDIKHGGSQVYVQRNVRHPAIHNKYLHLRYQA